jgi:peptidoglycan/xylan/chitin deacetylase (PgdA/CDA1 family)
MHSPTFSLVTTLCSGLQPSSRRALAVLLLCVTALGVIALPAQAAAPALGAAPAAASGTPGFALVQPPPGSFITVSYHEVRDEVRDYPDPYAVDSAALVAQFAWLRGNGYTPVSLADILAARAGGAPLPPRAVLLTFDDGYLSFYTRVYPLLRAYNYPALLAVVGKWIEQPAGAAGQVYGEKATVTDASFPSWTQLREMAGSGLVEMASHSYDLHRGVPANPQGNAQPAATARIYDPAGGTYETDAQWRARVRADLARSIEVIERGTGQRPRAMVWPYGSYNGELMQMAAELGMPVGITLDDGINTPQVPLAAMRRTLLVHNPSLADFTREVRGPQFAAPVRVVEVGLDGVYDADPARQEQKLSTLLDRVLALHPTHVYLRAFSDAPGGAVPAAYFPTRQAALRADLFNRVAWQLTTRSDVKVYAAIAPALLRMPPGTAAELLADLARAANFDGLYFMPPERIEPAAIAMLNAATAALTAAARQWRAPLALARGIGAASDPAQAIAAFTPGADLIVLTGAQWPLATLQSDLQPPGTRPRLVMMFDRAAGAQPSLQERMRALQRGGLRNFGYRDDDFLHDQPPLADIAPALSVREYPR